MRFLSFTLLLAACAANETAMRNLGDGGSVLTGSGSGAGSNWTSGGGGTDSVTQGGSSSGSASGAGDVGGSDGGSPGQAGGGAGSTEECDQEADLFEPNESESNAHDYNEIDDCDGSAILAAGSLLEGDVDWFSYTGNDTLGCLTNPAATVTSDAPVRVCQFVECLEGDLELTCEAPATEETSPDGVPGCCADTEVSLNIGCGGSLTAEDAQIAIRVDKPPTPVCASYELLFHF